MARLTDEEFDNKVIGTRYNNLVVQSLDRIEYRPKKNSTVTLKTRYYNCLCDCGNSCVIRFCSLSSTKSCGCSRSQPRKKADLSGQRFGQWTVLSLDKTETIVSKNGKKYDKTSYNCLCDCGNTSSIVSNSLTSGNSKSCGCLRAKLLTEKAEDISGKTFNRLTATTKQEGLGNYWLCLCECGNETIVKADALRGGYIRSCGCLQKEHAASTAYKIVREYRLSKGLDPDKSVQEERELERGRFAALRTEIFKRDSYTCACCSVVGSKLNVHHIQTWALAPELRFEESNLVTLCISCHKDVHRGNFNAPPDEIMSILLQGYTKVISDYRDQGNSTYDLL